MPSNFFAVAQKDREYVIPFVGLKIGVHEFNFDITDEFFEGIEYALINKGDIHVKLLLDKKETMLVGDFTINGSVETSCDRCNDPVNVDVEGNYQLIYKFDDEPSDDESLIIVYPEEFEIDVKENILELISVSLPARSVHKKGQCNAEMIELLKEYKVNPASDYTQEELENETDDEAVDPRWAALKDLKKDNKEHK